MHKTTRDAWSAKARQIIPELRVLGALQDATGWLVRIDIEPTVESLAGLENKIKLLGATAWHWEIDKGRIKMRIYTGRATRARWTTAGLTALTALILCWYYDILDLESINWFGTY